MTDGSRTWVIDRNDPATPGVSNSTGRVESISDGTLTVTPTYTPFGETETFTYAVGSSEYAWDLSVDIGGRIDGKAETLGVTTSDYGYDYDEIGQLTEVVDHLDSDAVVESYDYDANGNRISSTVDYGTSVSRTYAYNADDQLTAINDDEIEYDYDLDGFLTERRRDTGSSIETTGYVYNTRGELLSVDLPAGGAVERVEYTYDPLGRRIARRAYDDEDTLLSTEKYLWNGLTELLAVYDGSNQLQQRFDYLGGGLPVGVEIWDGTGFDYYYLAYDQIGSLRYVFDEAGSVAKAITYDAFGNVLSDSNSSLKLPLGFAGGHTDQDTGLVRFVARDYDPEIGRWTAGDPIGIQGGLNAYLYVGNDPVNVIDPYGLASNWLDRVQFGLGVAGLFPVFGIIPDAISLGISLARGDWAGAAVDAGSMLPGVGAGVRTASIGVGLGIVALRSADDVAGAAAKTGRRGPEYIHKNSVNSPAPAEHYVVTDSSGKSYHGVGDVGGDRAARSKKRLERENPSETFTIESRQSYSNRGDAYQAEDRGITNDGGPSSRGNDRSYNVINSPGHRLNNP